MNVCIVLAALAAEVAFEESFEAGEAKNWTGTVTDKRAWGEGKRSLAGLALKGNKWFGMRVTVSIKKDAKLKTGSTLNFAYWSAKPHRMKIQGGVTGLKTNVSMGLKIIPGKWVLRSISFTELKDDKANSPGDGMTVRTVTWFTGNPDENFEFYIDEVSVSSGGLPEGFRAAYEEEKRIEREITGRPSSHGYFLDPEKVQNVKLAVSGKGAKERTILCAGSGSAASSFFINPLIKNELKGWKCVRKSALSGRGKTIAWALKKAGKVLSTEKPEFVLLLFDGGELMRGATAASCEEELKTLVNLCLEGGAVPVLYTVPGKVRHKLPPQLAAVDPVRGLNPVIAKLARDEKLPMVDATFLLNPSSSSEARKLWIGKSPGKRGYDKINSATSRLLRVLEKHALDRSGGEG